MIRPCSTHHLTMFICRSRSIYDSTLFDLWIDTFRLDRPCSSHGLIIFGSWFDCVWLLTWPYLTHDSTGPTHLWWFDHIRPMIQTCSSQDSILFDSWIDFFDPKFDPIGLVIQPGSIHVSSKLELWFKPVWVMIWRCPTHNTSLFDLWFDPGRSMVWTCLTFDPVQLTTRPCLTYDSLLFDSNDLVRLMIWSYLTQNLTQVSAKFEPQFDPWFDSWFDLVWFWPRSNGNSTLFVSWFDPVWLMIRPCWTQNSTLFESWFDPARPRFRPNSNYDSILIDLWFDPVWLMIGPCLILTPFKW